MRAYIYFLLFLNSKTAGAFSIIFDKFDYRMRDIRVAVVALV